MAAEQTDVLLSIHSIVISFDTQLTLTQPELPQRELLQPERFQQLLLLLPSVVSSGS